MRIIRRDDQLLHCKIYPSKFVRFTTKLKIYILPIDQQCWEISRMTMKMDYQCEEKNSNTINETNMNCN